MKITCCILFINDRKLVSYNHHVAMVDVQKDRTKHFYYAVFLQAQHSLLV